MDFEDYLKKDWYRSILALTYEFQGRENGLKQHHFRYALAPNHDNIINEKKMKTFFGKKLDALYKNNILVKDCITDRNNLTNFLSKLVKSKLLTKTIDEKKTKYTLSKKFHEEIWKYIIKQKIDAWSISSIENISELLDDVADKKGLDVPILSDINITGSVFGLDFLDECSMKEKTAMAQWLCDIEDKIGLVAALKYKKTKDKEGIAFFIEAD
ncbi:MAG: hypothetical protein NT038_03540 [Euryarchaeota archaeon]|nr:hypothetical protein [Euryarchaeota archaeon]